MGYTGNKGAICIRFNYLDTSICIINCHLAAHKSKIKNRNEQIKSILKQSIFSVNAQEIKIYEHDYIFWTGDLNYRLQDIETSLLEELLYAENYSLLLRYDQLLIEKKKGKVLLDFEESIIDFPPTFKYKIDSNEYS